MKIDVNIVVILASDVLTFIMHETFLVIQQCIFKVQHCQVLI